MYLRGSEVRKMLEDVVEIRWTDLASNTAKLESMPFLGCIGHDR